MRLGLVKHVVVVKTIAVTTNLLCEVRESKRAGKQYTLLFPFSKHCKADKYNQLHVSTHPVLAEIWRLQSEAQTLWVNCSVSKWYGSE
jgi:hypothetical protein